MSMYHPDKSEIKNLAAEGNLVPVWRELPADLETPVSVYLKLRDDGPSFLLESVDRGEQVGRYSFLGFEPAGVLTVGEGKVHWDGPAAPQSLDQRGGNPLAAAKEIMGQYRPVATDGLPRFHGGLIGYLAYDAVRFFERVPMASRPGLGLPDAVFMLANNLIVFDHVKHRLLVVANAHFDGDPAAAYDDAVSRIESMVARLNRPPQLVTRATVPEDAAESWKSNFDQDGFEAAVRQAKEYIAAGDIFQVVLSQRLSHRTTADSFSIYRALRMLNPSPYMFYLELSEDLRLIGSSPEMLVRLDARQAQVRPIAGTRPRGSTVAEDEALAEELLADPKERAEHVMLVDLGRNDLGRVCRYGSVQVPELMAVERYSHVMHIVSAVQGELQEGLDAFDLTRATFPAGTVSGAPKVRAMEIIAELEGDRRGPYAGGVGYFDYSGNMDTCIAIRTIVMQDDMVHVQAGAGIVADSDPAREYRETLDKARALAEAARLAESGSYRR
jgi:anthranilate synthase component 1